MRICFIGSDFPPTGGGISTFVKDWTSETSKNSEVDSVKVLIFSNKLPRVEKYSSNFEVKTLGGKGFLYTGLHTLFFMVLNFRSEIFHSLSIFPSGFWVVFWSVVFRKKSAVTVYGTDACSSLSSKKTFFLKRWTLSNATKVIAISEATKKHVKKRLDIEREIKVIYPLNPYNQEVHTKLNLNEEVESIKKKYSIDEGCFVVLNISRLVKRKGLLFLVESASLLKNENIKFIFVGKGGEESDIKKEIIRLGVSDKVIVTGYVESLEPFYGVANVSTLVSYFFEEEYDFEGLGLVLVDSSSRGIPVIGSDSGGIPEAIVDGKTGFIVPEKNAKAIADKIMLLKNDADLARRMGEEGRNFVQSRFNRKGNIKEYLDYIRQ